MSSFLPKVDTSKIAAIVLISLLLVVLLYIFIIPEKKRNKLNPFFKAIHDFLTIKSLLVEAIFRFIYIFSVVLCIVFGFYQLFKDVTSGLLFVILGPIICRIIYEFAMMMILLVKNTIEINNHLKGIDSDPLTAKAPSAAEIFATVGNKFQEFTTVVDDDKPVAPAAPAEVRIPVPAPTPAPAPAPAPAPTEPAKPENLFCPVCGKEVPDDSVFCVFCGTPLK